MAKSDDYITDVPYPRRFHREHAPIWLNTVAAALGLAAPSMKGGRWCEVGCGRGLGASILAAANPEMEFTGIDLDAGSIEEARSLAHHGRLDNLRFVNADIRTIGKSVAPDMFDYIVVHGVYSWVGDDVRKAIRCFISENLRPGGIAYLHYATHPGSSAFASFQNIFRHVAHSHDDTADAVRSSISRLRELREAGAGFFVAHPAASFTLDHLLAEDPGYVAHEYLNPFFQPMHVADVMAEMKAAGLSYVGSATPLENINSVSLPEKVRPLIEGQKDLLVRESFRDMAVNQALRRDVYIREPKPLSAGEHLAALRAITFCALPDAPKRGGLTFDTRIGPVEGNAAIFSPLLERLADGPVRFADLEGEAPFAGRAGLLNQCMQMLMWWGTVHPVHDAGSVQSASGLNRVLVKAAQSGEPLVALAAPRIGSGYAVGDDRPILDALSGQDSWLRSELRKLGII